VTVCGAPPREELPVSGWDAACGFASGADAARTRADEDDAACARVRAAPRRLRHADGAYGGPPSEAEVRAAVEDLLPADATLWLPAAIGGQPDHRAVRDALLPLVAAGRTRARLYADSPYAAVAGWDGPDGERPPAARWEPALAAVADAAVGLGEERRVRLEGPRLDAKLALVRCHASQLAQLGGVFPGLSHRAGPLATEVSWVLRGGRARRWSLRFRR
jgi:LmbE family N-acetylglucosaminyl deacetylase